ncbi:hypothetical protein F511_25511 [Dorcoceras hygrometricum]|uniref:Uncharacterized protein n=1 Tax=Dorcoceras hygrometricum TaxID=472368 RepID=A0A2Z7D2I0_9LAMI|nr:hypothetical protein F511_25511 [Dorcoceras hygrometricum]
MGPISYIGPKTSRAARERPELNLEGINRHDIAGASSGDGRHHENRAAAQGHARGRDKHGAPCAIVAQRRAAARGRSPYYSPAETRRQPLLTYKAAKHSMKPENANIGCGGRSDRESRIGEAAGACAAVCCCFPCAAVHFLLLPAYRLPRSLWRRKKRRNRRSSSNEAAEMNQPKINKFGIREDDGESIGGGGRDDGAKTDVFAWENEIWPAGFWRSSSRRSIDE